MVGIAMGDGKRPAMGVIHDFFKGLSPENLYVGYDHEVYPQFEIKTMDLIEGKMVIACMKYLER